MSDCTCPLARHIVGETRRDPAVTGFEKKKNGASAVAFREHTCRLLSSIEWGTKDFL